MKLFTITKAEVGSILLFSAALVGFFAMLYN